MAANPPPATVPDLETLARARFPDLKPAELKLVRAVPKGDVAICGPSGDFGHPSNDPSKSEDEATKWGEKREIRAELIRWLCLDPKAKELVDPKGIQILGAKITGALDLQFVSVPFPLRLQRCRLLENSNLQDMEASALDLQGTWARSISADRVRVRGTVFLRNGFHAEGAVRLLGAQIGGDLSCVDGKFINPPREGPESSGVALFADGIDVRGQVFLRNGFRAEGAVRLLGAQIGGQLSCIGGTFHNPPEKGLKASGVAFHADGINVKGSVLLRDGFRAEGAVSLLVAKIGEDLECGASTFINPPKVGLESSGDALSADGIDVKGDVFLRNGFHAEGAVDLPGAQIGGDLDCSKATFHGQCSARRAVIKGGLFWRQIVDPRLATFDFRNATVTSLYDDRESWPGPTNLFMDGFVYQHISAGPKKAKCRLDWLALQKDFSPQPYRQLAKVLADDGDEGGARDVLVEMERKQRKEGWLSEGWSMVLEVTVGYGYYPWRAIWGLGALTGLGWIIYRRAQLAGAMTPSAKEDREYYVQNHAPPPHCVGFSPFVYSLENSLPLVKLGQADHWQPEPVHQACGVTPLVWGARFINRWKGFIRWAMTGDRWGRFKRWTASPRFLWGFLWIQILLGWVLASLFAAGVTGIVHSK